VPFISFAAPEMIGAFVCFKDDFFSPLLFSPPPFVFVFGAVKVV